MKTALWFVGAGGHAKACADVLASQDVYRIELCVDPKNRLSGVHSYVASDEEALEKMPQGMAVHIALGTPLSLRETLYQRYAQGGASFPNLLSSQAYIAHSAQMGEGNLMGHHALCHADSVLGDNNIINTKALIEHDVKIGSHCHIAPGAVLLGGVHVGSRVFVGAGAIIFPNVHLADNSIVPAGSVVKS